MTKNVYKKIKNYWNERPCNIRHSKKKLFSREYFQEVKKKRYFVEGHIRKFAEFEKYKNKNVLEIGCGIGTDAIEFIKNKVKYTGIEYSNYSLDIAKKRVDVYKYDKFKPKLLLDNAENLKNIKKLNINFDLIYSFGVLHHTPNLKKCFKAIYDISTKNTEIKLMLYAKNSYKNFMLDKSIYRYEAQKGCPIVHKIDISDLNDLVKKKFKIISCTQDFIFPYNISQYKKNIYQKINYFKIMPKNIFKSLEKNIGEHMLIKLKKIEK